MIWDEVQYEGDLPMAWGSLSAQQEVDRFWWGASLGVHVGHSETLLRPNVSDDEQPLWWAKGGVLIGTSAPRIRFMRSVWSALAAATGIAFAALEPTQRRFGHGGPPVANQVRGGRDTRALLTLPTLYHTSDPYLTPLPDR